MVAFNTIEDVLQYLDDIPMFGKSGLKAINPGLDSIRLFCERIGNPQRSFKSIHVAGTNGKGSTCFLLEHIYRNSGLRTGLFTSPHLIRYQERFRINGEEVGDEKLIHFFNVAKPILEEIELSYFEISTAFSFWLFAEEKVDIAIIETGLGGRFDSTNIIQPLISAITSISKDHEQILGNTIERIASEKAGIIKRDTPVVLGNFFGNAQKVIEQEALKEQSVLIESSDLLPIFDQQTIKLDAVGVSAKTNFLEPINAWNVAISYSIVDGLREVFPVDNHEFEQALVSFKGVPARFERLLDEKDWFFSGSHNIEAIEAMLEGLNYIHGDKTLILSLMKDKAKPELLTLFNDFNEVFYYTMDMERAAVFNDIGSILKCEPIDDQSFQTILKEIDTEVVIFAGSFYFYPVVKRWVDQNNL